MQYYFAPMEGLTSHIYRNAHHRHFGGVDKYFMPFYSPTQEHNIGKKELRDILPAHNEGLCAVPQLLTRRAEDFIWAAGMLRDLGYTEVNLNLGCPSGTVVAKGKGSGFLALREELAVFLDEIFSQVDISISIKTRLGKESSDEFPWLLEQFQKYPASELIIHPRVQRDFYKNSVQLDSFALALEGGTSPICYNGDIMSGADCATIAQRFPAVDSIMLGRGLAANPMLARQARGEDAPMEREALRAFLAEIFEGYCIAFGSRRNAMLRMKEQWFYLGGIFEDSEKQIKKIRKTSDSEEYERLVEEILQNFKILNASKFDSGTKLPNF